MPHRGLQPQKKRQKVDENGESSVFLTSPIDPSLYSDESRGRIKKARRRPALPPGRPQNAPVPRLRSTVPLGARLPT